MRVMIVWSGEGSVAAILAPCRQSEVLDLIIKNLTVLFFAIRFYEKSEYS